MDRAMRFCQILAALLFATATGAAPDRAGALARHSGSATPYSFKAHNAPACSRAEFSGTGRGPVGVADGAVVWLRPRTHVDNERCRVAGKPDAKHDFLSSQLKGGLRTITGLIGRAHIDNRLVRAPTVTLGIR